MAFYAHGDLDPMTGAPRFPKTTAGRLAQALYDEMGVLAVSAGPFRVSLKNLVQADLMAAEAFRRWRMRRRRALRSG